MLKTIVYYDRNEPIPDNWDDEAWLFRCPHCSGIEQTTEKERANFIAYCSLCKNNVELMIDTPLNQILVGAQKS